MKDTFKYCADCATYHNAGDHLPHWHVVDGDVDADDRGHEFTEVRATGPGDAVERYADQCEGEDWKGMMGGVRVFVRIDGGVLWKAFDLSGEYKIEWDALEVDE